MHSLSVYLDNVELLFESDARCYRIQTSTAIHCSYWNVICLDFTDSWWRRCALNFLRCLHWQSLNATVHVRVCAVRCENVFGFDWNRQRKCHTHTFECLWCGTIYCIETERDNSTHFGPNKQIRNHFKYFIIRFRFRHTNKWEIDKINFT